MSFDAKAYKKIWMRRHRDRRRKEYLILHGKCPHSEIILLSKYHYADCPCNSQITPLRGLPSGSFLRIKMIKNSYIPVVVISGIEFSFNKYFKIYEGGHFQIALK